VRASRRAALFAALGIALAGGCEGRPGLGKDPKTGESLTGPAIVELNLSRGLSEAGASTLFGSVPGTSHFDLVRTIREIDPEETKGVFVRLGTARFGLPRADEVGRLLKSLRDKDVRVVCHADEINNGSLLLAARGCSTIWLSPAGSVDTVGLAFQLLFGKDLLQKIDARADFLQVGDYKGAKEPYTRSEPSPEARETVEGTLADLRAAWLGGLATGRGDAVMDAAEDGPYTAKQAKELGLVDEIGFLDEARAKAKSDAGAERTITKFGGRPGDEGGGFGEVLRAMAGSDPAADPHVAVVKALGPITMRSEGGLLGGDEGITEAGLGKLIKELTEDEAVKAVVLRIDSPGGSALASDLLWHRLMALRKKKPLVVSVGGMAASGGYYLSCAGSRIFAEPTSIVGSIGVVSGKIALGGTLQKVGVNVVTIPAAKDPRRAARATMYSPFDEWDDATRTKVLGSMQSIYDLFLDRIAEGRGIDRAAVMPSAEGRIFGGVTAKERRLVDEVGGLDDAIRHALEESGLGAEGRVRLRGQPPGFLELFGGSEEAARLAAERARDTVDPVAKLLATLPPEARDWLGAAAPLAEGELTVAAIPFVLLQE
jgi:protease-4